MDYRFPNHMAQVYSTSPRQRASAGFTVIELVIVLVLVGVLAAYALPRINPSALQVTPVAEQIAAEIRYAQNLAMSRSQSHTFNVNGNTMTISNEEGAVALSNGQASVSFSGVSVGDGNVTFSPRFGQPSGGASINVDGGGSSVAVQVSGETGYVRVVQ